jgi:hypothetical protein
VDGGKRNTSGAKALIAGYLRHDYSRALIQNMSFAAACLARTYMAENKSGFKGCGKTLCTTGTASAVP